MEQFECRIDRYGNLMVSSGFVYQHSSQALKESGADPNLGLAPSAGMSFVPGMASTGPRTAAYIGGSGRLLIATPSTALDNPDAETAILGFFAPDWLDYWKSVANQSATLEVTTTTDAMIYDGTNIVAQWASGADAPLGVYAATTYGKNTYNAGSAFNITVTEELTGGRSPAPVEVEFSAGTAQGGRYSPNAAQSWRHNVNDWTLVMDGDGVAEIKYQGNVVATRIDPDLWIWDDPGGAFQSTTYGATNFNSGNAFTATAKQINAFPRSGYAIVPCTIDTGVLQSVGKPYFSTSIPANTSTKLYLPVFYSNGSTIAQQLHTGMLFIP